MTSRLQPDSPALPTFGRRWLALCCALLFAAFSTAQAAHIHRPVHEQRTFRAHSFGVSAVSDPDADGTHCPLCTAAHSALPATQAVLIEQLTILGDKPGFPSSLRPFKTWHFAQRSRPPPPVSHV